MELLQVVGGGLNTLQLVGFPDMSDSVLTQGIAPYCVRLETLSLAHGESLVKINTYISLIVSLVIIIILYSDR